MTAAADGADDNILRPSGHLWIHLADARGRVRHLSAAQMAVDLDDMAARGRRGQVTNRAWDNALVEEAARRFREMDGQ